jgi:primosomal protein N' (replication factor Y)
VELHARGYGTERVEQFLVDRFPDSEVIRVDRDSTRRKDSLNHIINRVQNGKNQILLGTQMLAKGHDFPNVTLVGILDADQGLYGSDFRSLEKLSQLIVQVAGRAGRGDKPGQVIIQTHHPDHPLLQTLVNEGYSRFAQLGLEERKATGLPPYTYAALIRAEANQLSHAMGFLSEIVQNVLQQEKDTLDLLGPVPAPIEKRAGRFRAQLLILSGERKQLHQCLHRLTPMMEKARKVRWSLDVDPIDLS